VKASDLIGATVATEAGEKVGHVFDVRMTRVEGSAGAGAWLLKGLVVGERGLRERLGLSRAGQEDSPPVRSGELVPWDAVVRVEERQVIVRRGPGR
jgi:sporulation protein YlmC with PRC-barrel domain